MKPWVHAEIMGLVPYELPDIMFGSQHKIGVGVMPRDPAGKPVPALAEMLAPYAAVHPSGKRLIFAAPMMYQTIAATASLMRRLIDEVDNLVAQGHVKEETMRDLMKCYEAVERESLTAMQVATEGLDTVANGLKGGGKS